MPDPPRVVILDDYQGIALTSADWSPLGGRVVIDVFRDHISDEDELVKKLQPYTIICAMRERTKLPRSVLERLPNLRCASLAIPGTRLTNTLLDSSPVQDVETLG